MRMYGAVFTARNQSDKSVTPSCHGDTNTQRPLFPFRAFLNVTLARGCPRTRWSICGPVYSSADWLWRKECGVSSAPTHWNVLSPSRAKRQGPPWRWITVWFLHISLRLITDYSFNPTQTDLNRPLTSDDVDAPAQLAHWEWDQNWNFKSKTQTWAHPFLFWSVGLFLSLGCLCSITLIWGQQAERMCALNWAEVWLQQSGIHSRSEEGLSASWCALFGWAQAVSYIWKQSVYSPGHPSLDVIV